MKELVEEQLELFGGVGAAVAVVYGDQVLLSDGFGTADVRSGEPVTADTTFCIGSTTKAFTAAAVAALVDNGLLEWDRPVRHYLSDFAMADAVATERLTVRDMLSHRSGLPRHDLIWYGNDELSRADLVARLRHLEPTVDLRTLYQYNNLLYIAAGHLCEVVTGQSWEQVVSDRLLDPLRMTRTTFSPRDSARHGAVAAAHLTRDGRTSAVDYARGTQLAGPAGSICAPIGDLVPWMRMHLGVLDPAPVTAQGVRELQTPQVVLREPAPFPEQRDWAYGLGWALGDYRGHRHVHHSGTVDGFTALISLLPEQRLGVAVLANVHGSPLPWSLAYALTDRVLGSPVTPWTDRFAAVLRALQQPSDDEDIHDEDAAAPHDDYLGRYHHPGYGELTVEAAGGGCVVRLHGLTLSIAVGRDDVVDVRHDFHRRRMTGTFLRDGDGRIVALTLAVEPDLPPLRFSRQKE